MIDNSETLTDPPGLGNLVGKSRTTVPQMLRARTAATPENLFLIWNDRRWSYADALDEARQFSGWVLSTSSKTPNEPIRVASYLTNCPQAVWVWLGTAVSGATYIPINRAHRGDILQDMLARSRAEVLVTEEAGLDQLPNLSATLIRVILVVDTHTRMNQCGPASVVTWDAVARATAMDGPNRQPGDPIEIMFTSGTTGRSKAVVLSHNQLCRGSAWIAWSLEMTENDVIHGWLPLFHIAGQLDMVLPMIVMGGCVALQPTFSRTRFWNQVNTVSATLFIGFSNLLEILWQLPQRPDDAASSLRAGIIGRIPPGLHRPFEKRFGVSLFDVYGMTEMDPLALPMAGQDYPAGSAGKPNPDFEVAILADDDRPISPPAVGEIVFRPRVPDVMAMSYEGDDAAFISASRNLWFHTGDLGRFDEAGFLYFIERRSEAIRRRGENISSFEIERTLLSHPAVQECAAVGVPSSMDEQEVKIVVIPAVGNTLEPEALRAWCAERMAAFMVPRYIEIVDALPRSPTGKVQKLLLRDVSSKTFDADK